MGADHKAGADALAGAIASMLSLWIFYPMDVIKSCVQAGCMEERSENANQRNPISWTMLIAPDVWRGWHVKTLHTASSSFCYFYAYSWLYQWYCGRDTDQRSKLTVPTRLALSALAAMLNTFITLPLDVLSTHYQTGGSKDRESHGNVTFDRPADGVLAETGAEFLSRSTEDEQQETPATETTSGSSMWKNVDLKAYSSCWKGLVPALLLCTNPSINYTVYDFCKAQILRRRQGQRCNEAHSLSMMNAFGVGLLAKFTATLATYPLIRAKMMLMVAAVSGKGPFVDLYNCLCNEFNNHGVTGLYRGCRLQLLHTMLKSAVLMMARERISQTTHRILQTDRPR